MFSSLAATVLVVCLCPLDSQAEFATGGAQEIGRYQMAVGLDGTVFVLDTSSGRCWSRFSRGQWHYEGNPTQSDRIRDDSPLALVLPREKVQLTIKQRESKPIPGSNERIMIQLDDITGGQVLISITSDADEILLDDVTAEQGDVVEFEVGNKTFYCHIKELKNFLVGDDLAVVEVSSQREAFPLSEEREDTKDNDTDKSRVN